MADFTSNTQVDASESALFGYLSDVSNLPRYFVRMTSAEAGDGEEVRTTATMPDGREVRGNAWFRTNGEDKTVEWGSEGPSSYRGTLEVSGEGSQSRVEVRLHTTRVHDADPEVQEGIEQTLANIKRLVEQLGFA